MGREKLLRLLRELYVKGDLKELRRQYSLGSWMLTPEDRYKIEKAVYGTSKDPLIQYAIQELGWKLVKKPCMNPKSVL